MEKEYIFSLEKEKFLQTNKAKGEETKDSVTSFKNMDDSIKFLIKISIITCFLICLSYCYKFFLNSIPDHFENWFSKDANDWATFATYFSGIATPLLTLINTLLIVFTLNAQIENMKNERMQWQEDHLQDKAEAEANKVERERQQFSSELFTMLDYKHKMCEMITYDLGKALC
jgi:hypothetical protein